MTKPDFDQLWVRTLEAFNGAAVGAQSWEAGLQGLADLTGSKCAELVGLGPTPFLVITELDDAAVSTFMAAGGRDPAVNSRIRLGLQVPELTVLDDEQLRFDLDALRNPDYGATVEALGIPYTCLTPLVKNADELVGLSVLRDRKQGNVDEEERERFSRIAPHLRAAVRTYLALEGRAMHLTVSALGQVGEAAFVVDRMGRVRAWSSQADVLLQAGDFAIKYGRLRLRHANDAGLETAIAGALDTTRTPPSTDILAHGSDGLAYAVQVIPLPVRHGFPFDAGALVVARPPRHDESRAAQVSRLVFGLTAAESAVTAMLVSGVSAHRIAERQGVTIGTVRTHIRRIFEKTRVNNQVELIAKVTSQL